VNFWNFHTFTVAPSSYEAAKSYDPFSSLLLHPICHWDVITCMMGMCFLGTAVCCLRRSSVEPWGDLTARMHAITDTLDYFHLQDLAHAQLCWYDFQKLITQLSFHCTVLHYDMLHIPVILWSMEQQFPICELWPKLGRGTIFLVDHLVNSNFMYEQYYTANTYIYMECSAAWA
jgi:hypothetical protein